MAAQTQILLQLLIKTPAILQSRYLASGRYHSGVKRMQCYQPQARA